MQLRPGPTNSVLDVAGLRVGHADRRGDGWLTGTTVVLTPPGGAVGGVDVRGGGPGTRETDVLDPRNLVDRVHAVVLSGGSAFGLAAADGVMARLAADGIGFLVGDRDEVVPIVPAAVIFDLGRGGIFAHRPDAALGALAYDDATVQPAAAADPAAGVTLRQGVVGAGTGAVAGGLKGGVGTASVVLSDGSDGSDARTVVAALVVVNAFGSCLDPDTGELYAARFGLPGEFDGAPVARRRPPSDPGEGALCLPRATTIGVIATDAVLTKSQCAKLAGIGHDGLARAIRPVHTMLDGDTLFALATGTRGVPDLARFQAILHAGGDCVTRAVGHAMLAAETVSTAAGTWPALHDLG